MNDASNDMESLPLPRLDFHQVSRFIVKYEHGKKWEDVPMPGKGFGDPNAEPPGKYAVRNAIFGNPSGRDFSALAALHGEHKVFTKRAEYVFVRAQDRPLLFGMVDGVASVVRVTGVSPPKLEAVPDLLRRAVPCTESLWS